jgi:hypothetical protein
MKDFQQRVIDERRELGAKLDRLMAFLDNREQLEALPDAEQYRLLTQASLMQQYYEILREGIKAFG